MEQSVCICVGTDCSLWGTNSCVNIRRLFAACVNLEILCSAYVKNASSSFLFVVSLLLDGLEEKLQHLRGTGAKKVRPIILFPICARRDPARALRSLT